MLEEAINGLTAALREHTKVVQEGMAAMAAGGAPAAAGTAKPAEETTAKATPKPAGQGGRPPSVDTLRNAFKPFLGADETSEGKQRAVECVKPILEHYGVDKISQVPKEVRRDVIAMANELMEAFKSGGMDAAEAVRFPFSEDPEPAGEKDEDVL